MYKLLISSILLCSGCASSKYDNYTELHTLPNKFDEVSIDRYLLTKYKPLDLEQIRVIYFKDDLLIQESVSEGARYRAIIPVLDIIKQCALLKCNRVLFVHNHVACYFAHPSETDFDTTVMLKERFAKIGMILIAHVVVADHDTYWIR
jgi:DNA repair protein RadC